MSNRTKLTPIDADNVQGVFITSTLDTRKPATGKNSDLFPVAVRVIYLKKIWYYQTGVKLTLGDFNSVVKAKTKGTFFDIRTDIEQVHNKVVDAVKILFSSGGFSLEILKTEVGKRSKVNKDTLADYWRAFAESKEKSKTRQQYISAMFSFFRYMGADVVKSPDSNKLVLKGKGLQYSPKDIHADTITGWERDMAKGGLSTASRSIYLRAARAVFNNLVADKILREAPKFEIKAGDRRDDDFLTVEDIVKVRDCGDVWSDWWIIIYLCNGANLRDIATLEWGASNELSFKRSKTEGRKATIVYIPIVSALRKLLDEYASPQIKGQRVFPQILLNAETEAQISSRVHDFNAQIRQGMQSVCEKLGIKKATPSAARNSYITTLTWHGVSDAFIDKLVGHADGKNVLRGYQGNISAKRRVRINSLLFIDPDNDNDSDLLARLMELTDKDRKKLLSTIGKTL